MKGQILIMKNRVAILILKQKQFKGNMSYLTLKRNVLMSFFLSQKRKNTEADQIMGLLGQKSPSDLA